MKKTIIAYLASLTSLTILDSIWLGLLMSTFYKHHLRNLFANSILLAPALLFYIIYPIGITTLVVLPALEESLLSGTIKGAILGLMAYGAYDLTNHATLKEWPAIVTIVDLAWGAFVTSCATLTAISAVRSFK